MNDIDDLACILTFHRILWNIYMVTLEIVKFHLFQGKSCLETLKFKFLIEFYIRKIGFHSIVLRGEHSCSFIEKSADHIPDYIVFSTSKLLKQNFVYMICCKILTKMLIHMYYSIYHGSYVGLLTFGHKSTG